MLGVGSGEALNEHILGDAWPSAPVRLEMLDEAIEVMRKLWAGGSVDHRGRYYRVENARLYTLPEQPPKVYVSAFGPKSVELAARVGDGYISTMPDAELVHRFREAGGAGKPTQAGFKTCYAETEDEALRIVHRLWPNAGIPGELSQVLPSPRHFEQASQLVTAEMLGEQLACGPDPRRQLDMLEKYDKAGFDEVYVASVGPNYRQLCELYAREIL